MSSPYTARFIRTLVFLMIITQWAVVNTANASTYSHTEEFATEKTSDSPNVLEPASFMIGPSVTWLLFDNNDMDQTYGSMPLIGIDATYTNTVHFKFCFGMQYGASKGNPFYRETSFQAEDNAHLKILPVYGSVLFNGAITPNWDMNLGIQLCTTWCQEDFSPEGGSTWETHDSGWIGSFSFLIGPQWYLDDGRKSLGLEARYGGERGDIGHFVDLTSMAVRIYYQIKL